MTIWVGADVKVLRADQPAHSALRAGSDLIRCECGTRARLARHDLQIEVQIQAIGVGPAVGRCCEPDFDSADVCGSVGCN